MFYLNINRKSVFLKFHCVALVIILQTKWNFYFFYYVRSFEAPQDNVSEHRYQNEKNILFILQNIYAAIAEYIFCSCFKFFWVYTFGDLSCELYKTLNVFRLCNAYLLSFHVYFSFQFVVLLITVHNSFETGASYTSFIFFRNTFLYRKFRFIHSLKWWD